MTMRRLLQLVALTISLIITIPSICPVHAFSVTKNRIVRSHPWTSAKGPRNALEFFVQQKKAQTSSKNCRCRDWWLLHATSGDGSYSSDRNTTTSLEINEEQESIPETNEDETDNDDESESDGTSLSAASTTSNTETTPTDDSTTKETTTSSFRQRIRKLWWKNEDSGLTTRQRLAKMGLAAVLSYGWVSNVSYAIGISVSWYAFSKKTGLSPLAPDQWKPFLAVYAGFWVFNNVIRPLRLGLSIAISQYFDNVVAFVQRKTKFNKGVSIALVVFLFNVVGTIGLMCLGISLASLSSGVPVFPGKTALQ